MPQPCELTITARPTAPVAAGRDAALTVLLRAWYALRRVAERRRQRRALAQLDRRLLDDIGVSVEMARREAAKPFWRE